ncbi:MAG TPA: hypothetical protein VHO84_15585, partial [Syntrophorhabdaceae bacterium]|nr:hypothetical protein [Syntrophorhabdaceae bacterium]
MKKGAIVCMFLTVSLLLCTAPVHAWQGRMAGMGNAYGLVEDESDFLIHPAGIANGQGLNFYGNMRFGLQTTDKNSLSYSYAPVGDPASWTEYSYDASGRET